MASDDTTTGERLEYFWRPGCPFCMLLERDLDSAGIVVDKRNIWDEPEAAAAVRSVADGNETVPTVRIGGRALVNPSIDAVTALLAEVAPGLLPRT
jgi:glutaredoxin